MWIKILSNNSNNKPQAVVNGCAVHVFYIYYMRYAIKDNVVIHVHWIFETYTDLKVQFNIILCQLFWGFKNCQFICDLLNWTIYYINCAISSKVILEWHMEIMGAEYSDGQDQREIMMSNSMLINNIIKPSIWFSCISAGSPNRKLLLTSVRFQGVFILIIATPPTLQRIKRTVIPLDDLICCTTRMLSGRSRRPYFRT